MATKTYELATKIFRLVALGSLINSETQRLVQNVILKLEKINIVFVKPVMVNSNISDGQNW